MHGLAQFEKQNALVKAFRLLWLAASFSILMISNSAAKPLSGYSYDPVDAGYISCPQNLFYTEPVKEDQFFCDASAVSFDNDSKGLIFATDWWGSNYHFPFIHLNWDNIGDDDSENSSTQLKPGTQLFTIEKVEDMSRTESGQFTMATGSFTHTSGSYEKWQHISRVVYWKGFLPDQMMIPGLRHNGEIIKADRKNHDRNSHDRISEILRSSIKSAIQTQYPFAEYFKVEGLTFLPHNRVAFGIREVGKSHEDFRFVSLLLTTTYSEENDELILDTNFQVAFNYELIATEHSIPEAIGISSLEFDFSRNLLLMSTSFEIGNSFNQIGAYLWVIEYSTYSSKFDYPEPVQNSNGTPLRFSHKIEGITLDEKGRVILISDDDTATGHVFYDFPEKSTASPGPQSTYREPHQAHYNIIDLKRHW